MKGDSSGSHVILSNLFFKNPCSYNAGYLKYSFNQEALGVKAQKITNVVIRDKYVLYNLYRRVFPNLWLE